MRQSLSGKFQEWQGKRRWRLSRHTLCVLVDKEKQTQRHQSGLYSWQLMYKRLLILCVAICASGILTFPFCAYQPRSAYHPEYNHCLPCILSTPTLPWHVILPRHTREKVSLLPHKLEAFFPTPAIAATGGKYVCGKEADSSPLSWRSSPIHSWSVVRHVLSRYAVNFVIFLHVVNTLLIAPVTRWAELRLHVPYPHPQSSCHYEAPSCDLLILRVYSLLPRS